MYIYAVNIQELRGIRIGKTKFYYSANSDSIKIFTKEDLDKDLELKFEFKGDYIGKKCCFRIDQKGRFKFLGEAKPPKDPIKKLFWENGFTDSKRKKNMEDVPEGDNVTLNGEIIFRHNNKKVWWADESLTLNKVKDLMNCYEIGLNAKKIINMLHTDNGVRLAGKHMMSDDLD